MNPKYFATPEEVTRVVDFLNKHSIGGGVKSLNMDRWYGVFSTRTLPYEGKTDEREMVNVVLNSGVEMNAGLTLDLMTKGYAEWMVASMLQAMAAPASRPKDD